MDGHVLDRAATPCPRRPTRRWMAALLAVASLVAAPAAVGGGTGDVARAVGEEFFPITPTRVLDTRDGTGGTTGPVGPATTITLDVVGSGAVPDDASAVVINVTSVRATESSFVTIWPSGEERPLAASLNLDPGQDTPNLVIVGLGDGAIDLYNDVGSTHLVGDVTGYFVGTSELTPVTPTRLLDTRDGTGGTTGPVEGGDTVTLTVAGGETGVPETADAVVVNITSIRSTEPAFVTVHPTGTERPLAASLNTEPGQNTPNLAIAAVGTDGQIDIYVSDGATHLTADVTGYFDDARSFVAATPYRVLDTRNGVGAETGPLGPEAQLDLTVAGVGPVPEDAVAVVVNITSIRSTEPAFVTAWPTGEDRPLASTLNTEPGQNTPNLAVLKLGEDGAISLYNSAGTTHLTADVAGWFVTPAPEVLDLTDRSQATLSGFGVVEDNGITSGGTYTWNTTTRVLEVEAGASAFATAQDFIASSKLRADFIPLSETATFSIDLDWSAQLVSFVGADAGAEFSVTARLIPRTGPMADSIVWEHVFVDEGIGSGVQVFGTRTVSDRSIRTFTMPTLDPNQRYRVEVEARCRARVAFSIGATTCDARSDDRDVRVRDWSLTFTH